VKFANLGKRLNRLVGMPHVCRQIIRLHTHIRIQTEGLCKEAVYMQLVLLAEVLHMQTSVRHTLRNAGALQVKLSRKWPRFHHYDTPRTVEQVQLNPQGPRVPAKRGAQPTHDQYALHDRDFVPLQN